MHCVELCNTLCLNLVQVIAILSYRRISAKEGLSSMAGYVGNPMAKKMR